MTGNFFHSFGRKVAFSVGVAESCTVFVAVFLVFGIEVIALSSLVGDLGVLVSLFLGVGVVVKVEGIGLLVCEDRAVVALEKVVTVL